MAPGAPAVPSKNKLLKFQLEMMATESSVKAAGSSVVVVVVVVEVDVVWHFDSGICYRLLDRKRIVDTLSLFVSFPAPSHASAPMCPPLSRSSCSFPAPFSSHFPFILIVFMMYQLHISSAYYKSDKHSHKLANIHTNVVPNNNIHTDVNANDNS